MKCSMPDCARKVMLRSLCYRHYNEERSRSTGVLNGDRTDNRIENLELWNTRQPKGQRVADKVEWAKEILKLYGP